MEEPSGEGLSMDGDGDGDVESETGDDGAPLLDLGVSGLDSPGEMEVGLAER